MATIRAYWQEFPNECISYLYVDDKLFKWSEFRDRDETTSRQLELIESLEQVRGLKDFSIGDYELRATRGEVFSWEELRPKIESILLAWLGCDSITTPSGKQHIEPNRMAAFRREEW